MNKHVYRKIKGFRDIFGDEIYYWHIVEDNFKEIFNVYGYEEVKLPILERLEVFRKGLGDTSDIVDKEMFSFIDRDSQPVVLRPEGTASVVRFYIENNIFQENKIDRFYYYGPMFRRENPQKGRFRQFYQVGVEALGSASPILDSEVIKLSSEIFKSFNVNLNIQLEINSIGCQTCRQSYVSVLLEYLKSKSVHLCDNCNKKIDSNPLRVFDCKNELCKLTMQSAPEISSFLCKDCKNHFLEVKENLNKFNVEFVVNPKLVRGLDYYMRTAFEIVTDYFGATLAVGAGGRYDGLVKNLGGPDIPGIGFAIGVDRLVAVLKELKDVGKDIRFFVVYQNNSLMDFAIRLLNELRENHIKAFADYTGKGLKSQLRMANKYLADYALILGEEELNGNYITIKNMKDGQQKRLNRNDIVVAIKSKFIDGGVKCFQ
jgi:histidyl-tRNA synthetase